MLKSSPTVASRSAGPGTRKNIDEFTRTTASGIEKVGGARRGKAIIILNPPNRRCSCATPCTA